MRKFAFILAMLALLVTLGLAFVSCDDGVISGNEGGLNNGGSGNNTVPGTLTITDIPPQFNGMYACFYASANLSYNESTFVVIGAQSISLDSGTIVTRCRISNGRVNLPIWRYSIFHSGSGFISDPERQGSSYFILQNGVIKNLIIGEDEVIDVFRSLSDKRISFQSTIIEFTNGSATVSVNLGTLSEQ